MEEEEEEEEEDEATRKDEERRNQHMFSKCPSPGTELSALCVVSPFIITKSFVGGLSPKSILHVHATFVTTSKPARVHSC